MTFTPEYTASLIERMHDGEDPEVIAKEEDVNVNDILKLVNKYSFTPEYEEYLIKRMKNGDSINKIAEEEEIDDIVLSKIAKLPLLVLSNSIHCYPEHMDSYYKNKFQKYGGFTISYAHYSASWSILVNRDKSHYRCEYVNPVRFNDKNLTITILGNNKFVMHSSNDYFRIKTFYENKGSK